MLPRTPISTLFPYTTLFRSGCPSGQRERSVKPSAQPTKVRILHLPPPHHRSLSHVDPSASGAGFSAPGDRSEEHTSELQSLRHLVCRLLLEKKKKENNRQTD